MNNSVIIKHEQYGLRIRLSEAQPWEELCGDVREKFTAAAGFFADAALTLTFDGRALTEAQEDTLLDIIREVTRIRILCVFVEDPARQEIFIRAAGAAAGKESGAGDPPGGDLSGVAVGVLDEGGPDSDEERDPSGNGRYQMLLRSLHDGERYQTQRTVIVIGNVEEGASLTTLRDAIILGSARGVIRAGDTGSAHPHFVASSDLRPQKLSIDGVTLRGKSRLFSRTAPAIAAVRDNAIAVVPFDGSVEELFR